MTHEEAQTAMEAWKILSGFGVLGVVGFIFLAPLAFVIFRVAWSAPRHVEGLAKKAHVVLDNAIATQPKVIEGLSENTKQTTELALAISSIRESHTGLIAKLEPNPDHPFSAMRTEEAMLQLCGIIEVYAAKEPDDEVKHAISSYVRKMREVLTRKIGSRS